MPNATTINIPENININIGIPGQKGTNGLKGDKGDPFLYEDFTPDQLQALKGEKGDKGESLTFEDLTPDQVALLKGEKGDKGDTPTIPNTIHFLKENFIYLPSEDLDSVLLATLKEINSTSSFAISYEAANSISPFTVDPVHDGDENLTVHGYNHCKVQIANEAPVEILNNIATVPIPKNIGDFINVKYINFLGEVVDSKTIEKTKEDDTPAVVYQDATSPSMKLSVKGTKAVLDFIPGGRNKLRDYTLTSLQDKVKRLVIDFANSNGISDYVTFPFIPERIEIINYKANGLNLSFQGNYTGTTKVVTEKSIPGYTLNNNGEYEVYSLSGKSLIFYNDSIYIGDAL